MFFTPIRSTAVDTPKNPKFIARAHEYETLVQARKFLSQDGLTGVALRLDQFARPMAGRTVAPMGLQKI
jgi:hypothetical protein